MLVSTYQILMAGRTWRWQETEGVIVRSEMPMSRGWVSPIVFYEYEIGGKSYQGKRIGYAKVFTRGIG